MIKCVVIEKFSLEKYRELKNIERASFNNEEGKLYVGDKFECSKEMAEYLTGKNRLGKVVVKVIEVESQKKFEEKPKDEERVIPLDENNREKLGKEIEQHTELKTTFTSNENKKRK